jgi:hypothetical protein
VELRSGQDHILLPEGLFSIDRRERPKQPGWNEIDFDQFDQFITVIGLSSDRTTIHKSKG